MARELVLASSLPAVFTLPAHIDWRRGTNRAVGVVSQIAAKDDLSAVHAWLATYKDRVTTFASYRKEAIRLVLWSGHFLGKQLSSLTHEDMLRYQAFLADPQPADFWVSTTKRAASHPEWRPFCGPLDPVSQRQAMVILNTLFGWLVQAGYLAGNPLALSRRRGSRGSKRIQRFLNAAQIAAIFEHIETMSTDTARDQHHQSRCRWVFKLLFNTGLRISEACSASMKDIFAREDAQGRTRWWLHVMGKGGKEADLPMTTVLMDELVRYRTAFGLLPYPSKYDGEVPLVFSIGKARKSLTRQAVHLLVKTVMGQVEQAMREQGRETDADRFSNASAHWLRHSLGTHLVNAGTKLSIVRDALRHANIATTNIYVHTEDDERHDELERALMANAS